MILDKYPQRIPLYIDKFPLSKLPSIEKKKYLVPKDFRMADVMYVIRKKIKLQNSEAIFLYVNNKLIPTERIISVVYDNHKDINGVLNIQYDKMNTFG